ncbi:hypothetical protein JCM19037_2169 [Geomicrobium sp. JCM 19037]|uniref:YqcI/YcgG family protein n=1 Tax=Geomicrobium sp. JCM 19037 TaxID=1460634 RepID=UPI00045F3822|nr:YqcI/YcgG family protein [Geomicrobium sp. JCM 19037]GAK03818.1 hypothetical protein JCM19037_2169 [Geomicrobium sp. JCM 19037]
MEVGLIQLSTVQQAEDYYLDKSASGWEREVFRGFCGDLLDDELVFPCVLGVHGLKMGELEFCFVPHHDRHNLTHLASRLTHYVQSSRTYGRNTSFVAFFEPDEQTKNLAEYEEEFWNVLQRLHTIDESEWPKEVDVHPSEPLWEFSYAGEPLFVVCNTPAHVKRKSRSAKTFMLTFQPRWVFDDIDGTTKRGRHIQSLVRHHLENYDETLPHPDLKWYGEPGGREWKQYFLGEDNREQKSKCPFHYKGGSVNENSYGSR